MDVPGFLSHSFAKSLKSNPTGGGGGVGGGVGLDLCL